MLLGFLHVGFGGEPLVDFYFYLVLWTQWGLLVVTAVTFPSEDPMTNQVPFGQLSWLVVVVVVLSVVVVVVVCFV